MGFRIGLFCGVTPSTTNDTWLPCMNTEAGTNMNSRALVDTPFFVDGVLDLMMVSVFTSSTSGTSTIYLHKNGVDGNSNVSHPAGLTGRYYDTVNSDTIANGDTACFRIDRTGACQYGFVGIYYQTNSGVIVNKVGVMGSSNFATGTNHLAFIGSVSDAITDGSSAQCPTIDVACEAKNIWSYNSASRTNTVVFSDRINAGAGGLSVTVPANTTGLRTASGSTPIAVGDNYNFQRVSNTGSGTFTVNMVGVDLHYPANVYQIFSANMGGVGFNATTARYAIPMGAFGAGGNLGLSSVRLYGTGKVKNLRIYIPTNAGTVAQQWHVIINGGVSALTTTSGIAATGPFSDTTNQPTFGDNQDISLRYLKSSGSGSTTLRWSAMTIEFDLPVGGNIKYWNGSAWVAKPVKQWNGSAWVAKPLKRYNGSSFVPTSY